MTGFKRARDREPCQEGQWAVACTAGGGREVVTDRRSTVRQPDAVLEARKAQERRHPRSREATDVDDHFDWDPEADDDVLPAPGRALQ